MNKLKYGTLGIFILLINSLNAQTMSSPQELLNKAINVITNAKGIEAKFTINNSGYSGSGQVRSLSNKFSVTLPDVEVWYNGKDLYTYNKGTNETTVVNPTAEELAETNPLAYVTGANKNYNVAFSTVKKTDRNVLELTPKKKSNIKRITLTLKKSDNKPEKIVVEPSHGNPITAEITSFRTGISLSSSDFEYPRSKYPKAEIVDLR